MSLRERFRPNEAQQAADPGAEARAAQKLAAQRGRTSIAAAPAASKAVAGVLRPLMRESGLGLNDLKRRWRELAGESFARATPEKLVAGVLTLRVPGALAPFLQQQEGLLIDRLKTAGAKIKSIRIVQRAAARPAGNVASIKKPLSAQEEAALAKALDHVADPGLKSALLRLGRAVKQG